MYKFDVRYTPEDYIEYTKYALIKMRLKSDIIFSTLFIGIGVFWLVDQSESTQGFVLPIVAFSFAVLMVCFGLILFPLNKRNIRKSQDVISRTHIEVEFNEEEIIYTNVAMKEKQEAEAQNASEAVVEEQIETKKETEEVDKEQQEPVEENKIVEETSTENVQETEENKPVEETSTENVQETEENKPVEETSTENAQEAEEKEPSYIIKFNYGNIMVIRETKNLLLVYLAKNQPVILPKATLQDSDINEFKAFIATKMQPSRVKFMKEKKVKEEKEEKNIEE